MLKENWEGEYFVVEANINKLCLIYSEYVTVFNDYNLKRLYKQKHTFKYIAHQRIYSKGKIEDLQKMTSCQQNLF